MKGNEKKVMHSKERILRSRSSPAGSEVFHSRGKSQVISDFKSFPSDDWINQILRKSDSEQL